MAHNSISPGFVKLYYATTNITHVQTIPIQPSGTPTVGVMPNLVPLTGGPISFAQFITDYMAVFRPFFSTITSIQSAEFWYAPTPTSDPIWIYEQPINLPGLTGAAASLMVQAVMTFRTALGGILKTYLMEPNSAIVANTRTAGASLTGINLAYSNYVKGATSCFLGRDNASAQVPIFLTTKVNDALRKRRMLM